MVHCLNGMPYYIALVTTCIYCIISFCRFHLCVKALPMAAVGRAARDDLLFTLGGDLVRKNDDANAPAVVVYQQAKPLCILCVHDAKECHDGVPWLVFCGLVTDPNSRGRGLAHLVTSIALEACYSLGRRGISGIARDETAWTVWRNMGAKSIHELRGDERWEWNKSREILEMSRLTTERGFDFFMWKPANRLDHLSTWTKTRKRMEQNANL